MSDYVPEIRKDAWLEGLPPRVEELRIELANTIPCHPDTEEVRADLHEMPLRQLFLTYITWIDRFIPPRPRLVQHPDDFWKNPIAAEHGEAIDRLARKAKAGEDLTPHLSTRVFNHGYQRAKPRKADGTYDKQWKNKDMALASSDIHHLHVYPDNREKDVLLFTKVERDKILFMMVGTHDDIRSGAAIVEGYQFGYQNGEFIYNAAVPTFTASENRELIQSGISTFLTNGSQVLTGTMQTSSGDALHYVQSASVIFQKIYTMEECLRDPVYVGHLFQEINIPEPEEPVFKWWLSIDGLCLTEDNALVKWDLFPFRR